MTAGSAPGKDEEAESANPAAPSSAATLAAQHRALDAVHAATTERAVEHLLSTTGPFAELTSAEKRGLLTEAKFAFIAAKGAGVTFEAMAVGSTQHAAERFGIGVRAALSTKSNDKSVDVVLAWTTEPSSTLKLQLKTGSNRYITAAIHAREDGVLLLVPLDAPGVDPSAGIINSLDVDGIQIDAPSRDELGARSKQALERLQARSAPIDLKTLARQSFSDAAVDGIVAAVLDLSIQLLDAPDRQIDWKRACRTLVKTGATSAISTFLAGTSSCSAVKLGKHSIDASGAYRGARVAACVVPHAIDVAFDWVDMNAGLLDARDFGKRTAGHAGAAMAELLFFKYVARFARIFGPLGQAVVMIGGGLLVSRIGQAVGETVFSFLSWLFGDGTDQPQAIEAVPEAAAPSLLEQILTQPAIVALAKRATTEERRRTKRADKGLCQEPRCGREHHARGMCPTHYSRWWRMMRRNGWRIEHRRRRRVRATRPNRALRAPAERSPALSRRGR